MTVLTDPALAKPATVSLPSELVEAGRLPGTTLPASRAVVPRPVDAAAFQGDADLFVDLSKMSILPAGFGTFVPPIGYVKLGSILGKTHRSALDTLGQVSRSDLVPNFDILGGGRERGSS